MALRSNVGAFTLLELVVVLGLLSLLFTIGLPRVSASLPGIFLDQAARALAAEAQLARVKAISRNVRVRLIVQLDRNAYRIEADSSEGFQPEGELQSLPGGVGIDAAHSSRISGNRISITFQPRGNTADNATIVRAVPGGAARRVIVNSAGRVRVQ